MVPGQSRGRRFSESPRYQMECALDPQDSTAMTAAQQRWWQAGVAITPGFRSERWGEREQEGRPYGNLKR